MAHHGGFWRCWRIEDPFPGFSVSSDVREVVTNRGRPTCGSLRLGDASLERGAGLSGKLSDIVKWMEGDVL
jgi:hypothetical protein